MTPTEAAELCEGIAETLREKGHTTYRLQNAAGQVCLLGAGRLAQHVEIKYQDDGRITETDWNTSRALGFSSPAQVYRHNDGHTEEVTKTVPVKVPTHYVFAGKLEELKVLDMSYSTIQITEEVVHPPITEQQAIDLAMDRAKYWRNQQ